MIGDRIALGSTKRMELEAKKDGVAWDFTSATITLYVKHPNGTITSHVATVDSPATAGIAYFVTLTTTLDTIGGWVKWFKIVDGSITEYTEPEHFQVYDPMKG